ncbi:MAG: sensor histidine kinase KdpD [Slackia sp.]|nr:sensor histidine kinase KdpD [Slackia sp.]
MEFDGSRRNPDDLLRRIKQDEQEDGAATGRLKIFFGYAAGVGKTYAMLEAAHDALAQGFDVAVGYAEPHQRPATLALLEGLECLAVKKSVHRGVALDEFDLDAALARHPQIVVVDELAHTNADECRHKKRYQDVEELLRAGIDVYTTMNVQHLESLNDKVAAITNVPVRERVPDRIFDQAASVELIDIEPDDLIERLHAGKVYRSDAAARALSNFFTRKNLAALREIALRRCADRLNRNPRAAGLAVGEKSCGAGEDVLLFISDRPGDVRAIRAAANMAEAYHGNLTALVVEPTGERRPLGEEEERRVRANVALAEELGAHVVAVQGDDSAAQIAQYAPAAGIERVVMGSAGNARRMFGLGETFAARLMRLAPGLTVSVVPERDASRKVAASAHSPIASFSLRDVWLAVGATVLSCVAGALLFQTGFAGSVVPMLFLLSILVVARFANTVTYSLVAALMGMFAYNFFFTYPRFTFMANGLSYPLIFACLALGGFVMSLLTVRMKTQAAAAARRAYRTEVLIDTSRRLRRATAVEQCLAIAADQTTKLVEQPVAMYDVDAQARLGDPVLFGRALANGRDGVLSDMASERERAVAAWVAVNDERAGATTDTLADSACLYLPIHGKDRVHGVAAVAIASEEGIEPFEKNLLVAILEETGQTMERIRLFQETQAMKVKAETESLRSNLLRSVSHDLRTPLTSISGNAEVLLESKGRLDGDLALRLYRDIRDDSLWLVDLVENLLAVTRAEEGRLDLHIQPEVVSDVVEEAVRHCERHAQGHAISIDCGTDPLLAEMDAALMVQVLVNLIGNAVNYTPAGSTIAVSVHKHGSRVRVDVADDGPGIPDAEKGRIFDMFYNGSRERGDHRRGMGLGLALCKSIVEAHGGGIGVRDAHPHGCVFWFTLPATDIAGMPAMPDAL